MKKPPKTPKTPGTEEDTSSAKDKKPEVTEELYPGQDEIRRETVELRDKLALNVAKIRGESVGYVENVLRKSQNLVSSYTKRLRHTTRKNLSGLRKKLFLDFLELGWSQADICRQFGFSSSVCANLQRSDEQFEAQVQARKDEGLNIAEGVIWRAAMMAGFDPRYQDSLKRLIQALDPEKWRDQKDLRVSTDMGILAENQPIEELIHQISITKIDITGLLPASARASLPANNRAFLPQQEEDKSA